MEPQVFGSTAVVARVGSLASCIEACFTCEQVCVACADACLAEPRRRQLLRCIRLCADCADVCEVCGRVLSRQTESDHPLITALLRACVTACVHCAGECAQHAPRLVHCRIAEEACLTCESACNELISLS